MNEKKTRTKKALLAFQLIACLIGALPDFAHAKLGHVEFEVVPALPVCKPKVHNHGQEFNPSDLERALFAKINDYRRKAHRPRHRLLYDPKLSQIARSHTEFLARYHIGASHFGYRKRFRQMGRTEPSFQVGENVAFNLGKDDPVESAFEQWKQSYGHRKLMLKDWDDFGGEGRTGVGITKTPDGRYYFTQVFLEHLKDGGAKDNKGPYLMNKTFKKRRWFNPFRYFRNLFRRH